MIRSLAPVAVAVVAWSCSDSVSVELIRAWPIRFYLSTNAIISAEDIPIGSVTAHADQVTPSWSRALTSATLRVPDGVTPSRYFLGAIVDPDAHLPDTNRENNNVRGTLLVGIGTVPSAVVAAPALLQPADLTDFDPDSTRVRLSWTSVGQAAFCYVELDHCAQWTDPAWSSSCRTWYVWYDLIRTDSTWTSGFPPEPGRWRVRGLDSDGLAGPASAWRSFRLH